MLEHPITQDEVLGFLNKWLERYDQRLFDETATGDISVFIAECLKRLVTEHWAEIRPFFEINRRQS